MTFSSTIWSGRSRRAAAALGALAGAIGMAACTSGASGFTGPPPPTHPSGDHPSGQGAEVDPHELLAEQAAPQELGRVTLPPGFRVVSSAPIPVVAQPYSRPAVEQLVERRRYATGPGSMSGLVAYLLAHLPAGASVSGQGSMGGSCHPPPGPSRCVTTTEQGVILSFAPSRALPDQQVVVSVAPDGAGRVAVGLDAQVTWAPTRLPPSFVPSTVRVATILFDPGAAGGPVRRVVVINASEVAKLRTLANRLPVAVSAVSSCPVETGADYTVSFAVAAGTSPVASLVVTPTECGGIAVTVNGTAQPSLSDTHQEFLDAVSAFFGPSRSTRTTTTS